MKNRKSTSENITKTGMCTQPFAVLSGVRGGEEAKYKVVNRKIADVR